MKHTAPIADHWRTAITGALGGDIMREGVELDPASVHALRRSAKRVRALVRLAPPSLAVLATDTTAAVDGLRRSLGTLRDDAVRRQTLETLVRIGGLPSDVAEAILRAPMPNTTTGGALPSVISRDLRALARGWATCSLADITNGSMADALAQSYRRARRRSASLRRAMQSGTASTADSGFVGWDDVAALHRWRRSVVDLHLQIGAFAAGSPNLRAAVRRFGRLRDLLGTWHDLDALRTHVQQLAALDEHELQTFETIAASRSGTLLAEIAARARRAFRSRPSAWSQQLAADLHASLRALEAGRPTIPRSARS